MTWLVFDAWAPDDLALDCTRWIAAQTAERHPEAELLRGEGATRDGLHTSLGRDEVQGVALFGHGNETRVRGSDKHSALDEENIQILAGRWAHVVACDAGVRLADLAAQRGADCFVGYQTKLIVQWNPDELPDDLARLFGDLVVATTANLAAGERDATTLKRCVSEAADAVVEWMERHGYEPRLGIEVTAQQLVDRMVVRRRGDH